MVRAATRAGNRAGVTSSTADSNVPGWRDVVGPAYTGMAGGDNQLLKRLPAGNPPAAMARPGMVVEVFQEDNYAEIVEVTPDACIARGESGTVYRMSWHEVTIAHVRPDPAAMRRQ